jgi:hypothetical protein
MMLKRMKAFVKCIYCSLRVQFFQGNGLVGCTAVALRSTGDAIALFLMLTSAIHRGRFVAQKVQVV